MKVYVNNELIFTGGREEAYERIQEFLRRQELFVTSITANDIPVEMSLEEALQLEGLEKMEISAATLGQLLRESLRSLAEYLPRLTAGLEKAAELFQQGDLQSANEIFIKAAEGLEWVIHLFVFLERNYLLLQERVPALEPVAFTGELGGKLKELLAAWENRDYVLVGDLLNYELVPFLEKVHAEVTKVVEKIDS